MRKMFFVAAMAAGVLSASAQAWEYSEELRTDVLKSTPDVEVEFVNCYDGTGHKKMTPAVAQQCMRQAWITEGQLIPVLASSYQDKDELRAKVASRVSRARQNRAGARSGSGSRRAGTSYNYQTSDAHLQWLENKREQQREAARRAAEKKRQEAMARKIADDNRAAAVTAATNARLQAQTDAAIARDHYHATEGAALAQQRARNAARPRGPQFAQFKPKSTGAAKASTLRGANKPRRVMYPQRRNTVRPQLQQVKRTITPGERAAMLKKALMVRAELRRQEKAKQKLAQYKGFVLDDHAVSTLGKDWSTPTIQPLAPPPLTSISAKIKAENERHKLIIEEMIEPTLREIRQQPS